MEFKNFNLPILAHRYVPRYVKVGPGPGPVINPGIVERVNQFQVGG